MSREAFQPDISSQSNPGATTGSSFLPPQQNANFEDTSRPVGYLCGDCDAKVTLKRGDPIRCKECGYRVLYKERTNRCVCPFFVSQTVVRSGHGVPLTRASAISDLWLSGLVVRRLGLILFKGTCRGQSIGRVRGTNH